MVSLRGRKQTSKLFGTARGRHQKGSRRIPRSIRQKTRYIFSRISLRRQRAEPLIRRKRLSIYHWNAGSRRGRDGAIEKQIAGKWHIITLQEAIEYVDHELLTNRFHVTHYGECAVLFSGDTSFSDVKVKSNHFHDVRRALPDNVFEGESGWVIHGIISRASFRRQPFSGQTSLTVISFHMNNNFAKKRGIGKKLILTIRAMMLEEHVDVVAGDFNGAAWRRDNSNSISIIEEAFADGALPMPPGSPPLWGPGAVPGMWTDVCGFLNPPDSDERWKIRQHGAFSIPHEALGIRQTDQRCQSRTITIKRRTRQVEMQATTRFLRRRGNQLPQSRRGFQRVRQRYVELTPTQKVHVEWMFFLFCSFWFCFILFRARACHFHAPHSYTSPFHAYQNRERGVESNWRVHHLVGTSKKEIKHLEREALAISTTD